MRSNGEFGGTPRHNDRSRLRGFPPSEDLRRLVTTYHKFGKCFGAWIRTTYQKNIATVFIQMGHTKIHTTGYNIHGPEEEGCLKFLPTLHAQRLSVRCCLAEDDHSRKKKNDERNKSGKSHKTRPPLTQAPILISPIQLNARADQVAIAPTVTAVAVCTATAANLLARLYLRLRRGRDLDDSAIAPHEWKRGWSARVETALVEGGD